MTEPATGDPYLAAGAEIASVLRAAHSAAQEITQRAEEDARRIRSRAETPAAAIDLTAIADAPTGAPGADVGPLESRLAAVRDLIARIERDREDLLRAAADSATWARSLVGGQGRADEQDPER